MPKKSVSCQRIMDLSVKWIKPKLDPEEIVLLQKFLDSSKIHNLTSLSDAFVAAKSTITRMINQSETAAESITQLIWKKTKGSQTEGAIGTNLRKDFLDTFTNVNILKSLAHYIEEDEMELIHQRINTLDPNAVLPQLSKKRKVPPEKKQDDDSITATSPSSNLEDIISLPVDVAQTLSIDSSDITVSTSTTETTSSSYETKEVNFTEDDLSNTEDTGALNERSQINEPQPTKSLYTTPNTILFSTKKSNSGSKHETENDKLMNLAKTSVSPELTKDEIDAFKAFLDSFETNSLKKINKAFVNANDIIARVITQNWQAANILTKKIWKKTNKTKQKTSLSVSLRSKFLNEITNISTLNSIAFYTENDNELINERIKTLNFLHNPSSQTNLTNNNETVEDKDHPEEIEKDDFSAEKPEDFEALVSLPNDLIPTLFTMNTTITEPEIISLPDEILPILSAASPTTTDTTSCSSNETSEINYVKR